MYTVKVQPLDPVMTVEERDRYWLAGLLEGEGSFLAGPPSRPGAPLIAVAMTDYDVVKRGATMFDRAVTTIHPPPDSGHKTVYVTRVRGAAAAGWMRALRPLMGARRQIQIDRAPLGRPGRIRWTTPAILCSAVSCRRPGAVRGLCRSHYKLWWKSSTQGRASRYVPMDPRIPAPEAPPPIVPDDPLLRREPERVWAEPEAPPPIVPDDPRWLAWLAGLLEGEGWFTSSVDKANSYPVVGVQMSDRDIVERAATILEISTVQVHHDKRDPGWLPSYPARVAGRKGARWMWILRPLMGERRARQIDQALAAYHPIRLTDPPTICTVVACRSRHRSRGLCHTHYMSWSRDLARGRSPRVRPLR